MRASSSLSASDPSSCAHPDARPSLPPSVGIICTRTNVHQIAREAIENATYVCEEHYGLFKGPPVQLICPKDLNFMYVPSHLVSPYLPPPLSLSAVRTRDEVDERPLAEPRPVRGAQELAARRRRDARRRLRELPARQGHCRRGQRGASCFAVEHEGEEGRLTRRRSAGHHDQDLGRGRRHPSQRPAARLDLDVRLLNLFSLSRACTYAVARRYTTANPENLDQDFQGTDFKAPMAGFGASLVSPPLALIASLTRSTCARRLRLADRAPVRTVLWRQPQAHLDGGVRAPPSPSFSRTRRARC